MKRYVLVGLGVLFFGVVGNVLAEMEVKVKDNTANNGLSIKEETTGSTIARFRGDGNVGIGTTNPTQKLEITNTTGNAFINVNSANNLDKYRHFYSRHWCG